MFDRTLKYIIVENGGLEMPIIFNETFNHSFIAEPHRKVVSAGFVILTRDGQVSAYGKSTTLGIDSRETDSELIKREILSET